jgi:transposase-like protein
LSPTTSRRQLTAEFQRDAVDLARTSGRPIAEIALTKVVLTELPSP